MNKENRVTGNYIASLWNFFASVKLTVVVLLTLAALSIIGTLIPQNENPAEYFRAFGPFLFQVLDTLDIFDMYRSWWFQGLIILLVINIIVCSIDRLQTTGKIIFTRNPKFNLENYRRRKSRQDFRLAADVETCKDAFQRQLAKSFGFCRTESVHQGYAHNGRQQHADIDPPPGSQKEASGSRDQVAEGNSRLGNQDIFFDHFRHAHIMR